MSHADLLKIWISMFVYQLPALAVSLAAVIVIFAKWKLSPSAAVWALLGFGLILFLGIVMPIVQTGLQYWVFQAQDSVSPVSPVSRISLSWAFSVVGIVSAVMHSVSYIFLLIAVFAGRSTCSQANPQPLDSR